MGKYQKVSFSFLFFFFLRTGYPYVAQTVFEPSASALPVAANIAVCQKEKGTKKSKACLLLIKLLTHHFYTNVGFLFFFFLGSTGA
jgi:hypothetical protein